MNNGPKLHQLLQEYKTAATTKDDNATSIADRTKTLQRQSSLRNPKNNRSLLKKSVSFNNKHEQIILIENVKSLPKRELHRRWMNDSDFEKIKAENELTLRYYDLGLFPHPHQQQHTPTTTTTTTTTDTVRGLERLTEVGTYKYRENYREAVFAVLSHQENTTLRSSPDQLQGVIAKAYHDESEHAILEAISIAQQDQKIAEQEYDLDGITIDSIRRQQQQERERREMEQKRLVHRVLVKPAKQLSRSLSLRSVMNPQA